MKYISALLLISSLLLTSCSQEVTSQEYIQRGQAHYDTKEWKSAIIEFKNAVKQAPDNAEARALLGKAYVETYDFNSALKELRRAMDLGHDKNELILALSRAYQQVGEQQKVIDEIKIEDNQTKNLKANIYAQRAMAYLRLKDKGAALRALEKAKELDSNAIDVRLTWATYENLRKNTDEQIKWLKPLLSSNGGNADAWSQMGEVEQRAGQLDKAEKAYSNSIELRQFIHYDYIRRSLVRITKGDYEGARSDIETLKKANANWPIIDHAEGIIAYQNKDYDGAQTHFNAVLKKSPNFAPSQFMMALTNYNKKNYQNAISHLEQYLSVKPDDYRANIVYIASMLKTGDEKNAIQLLIKLNQQRPEDFEVLSLLGNAYVAQGQYDKGVDALQKAATLEPDQAEIRLQLGSALIHERSTLDLGRKELIKATELDPDLHQADLTLYMSYMREKNYAKARQSAKRLDSIQKDSPLGANLIALSYLAEGDKSKAESILQLTLKRFPSDPLTSHNIASIYLQDKNLNKAKMLYEDVLQKEPSHAKTLNQLALISAREGNDSEVLKWLKTSVERNPDELSPKLLLATQLLRRNEPSQAVQVLSDVSQNMKDEVGYTLLMARAKMSLKEYNHATRSLKTLIEQNPGHTAGHFLLAQAYGYQNKPDKMRESLNAIIKLSPTHFSANLMLARLDLLQGNNSSFSQRVKFLEKNYPDSPDVKFLKAKDIAGNKNYAQAIETLSSIMKMTPHSEVIIDLAKNQWQAGDRQAAISSLELWIEGNTSDYKAMMILAQFYLSDNRVDEAKSTYQKLDEIIPDNSVVLNNLAWLMKDTDVDQGIVYGKKALNIDPNNPYIMDTLAMLYLESGQVGEAVNLSEQASKRAPDFTDIQLNYARVLVSNNEKSKAKDLLQQLLNKTHSIEKKKMIKIEIDKI